MKDLNRINYLKRKEKPQTVKADDTILRLIQVKKQERVIKYVSTSKMSQKTTTGSN